MKFADTIKEIRKNCILSQDDFAKEIGVSFSTVNRWETGKSLPNYKTMKKIKDYCEAHGVDLDVLYSSWKEN